MKGRKIWLMDVVLMRLILIVLLIFYHAFGIHANIWQLPYENFHTIELYEWLVMLSKQFRIQGMVFISGLLFGFNMLKTEKREEEVFSFIKQKAKRLLLPCFIFGIIYYIMFMDMSANWYYIIYRIINGCGHLWFLPMIFWCFIITFLSMHFTPPSLWKKVFSIVTILFSALTHIAT